MNIPGLPTRAANLLTSYGWTSYKKLWELVTNDELLKYRGIGAKAHQAICLWLGYDDEFKGLSTRARNVIRNSGMETRAEVLKAVRDETFAAHRNCGWGTMQELRLWLGLPTSPSPKPPFEVSLTLYCGGEYRHLRASKTCRGDWWNWKGAKLLSKLRVAEQLDEMRGRKL